MRARIYRQAKTATQSGQANTHDWILEYGQTQPRQQDSLMGWTGSRDTRSQLRLQFPDRESAVAYADRHAVPYDMELPVARVRKPKLYADNFRYDRVQNWTH
ncbi:MAG: ETC complex I subunit [Gluconacetobacter sp.]|uniref:ETC complex I subunit n=1 Tax=Gluconacetobacter dulcium TaxID=2729096 RepID=A0A7W4PGR1_9PROT|nr:ETC complex I subunit [Gluconacetobacter dulcium]MBB2197467.1 ETC complex I subunit [Gluconacetobacter dulcium]